MEARAMMTHKGILDGSTNNRQKSKSYWSRRNALIVLLLIAASHWFPSWLSQLQIGYTRPVYLSTWSQNVKFDNYSLSINGQRVFIHSGEFHTFRLPVPGLWPDILQKAKAAGLNAVSVYIHMGLLNPARGVIDLDGYRSLKSLFEAAMSAGIFIVLRPGPYINAETSAGGIAHWVTTEVVGPLRTNSTDYHDAWQDYIKAVINEAFPYQVTKGGPIIAIQIDNEYNQNGYGHREYFQELKDLYRASGIDVPLTYNDANPSFNFINGTGAADLYGLDGYPQAFDCSSPDTWAKVPEFYRDYHLKANPSQPFYVPEFQAGAYDPWGPNAPGYSKCARLTGPDFQSVFNKQLWASNAKMINYYMFYGGTSWGGIPDPGVYTSYDYGAPITEARRLTPKYTELKLQGLFIRSSPEFYKTDWAGNTTTGAVKTTSPRVTGTLLVNPDTQAGFYILRHKNSTTTTKTTFSMDVKTSRGTISIPQVARGITLDGRESQVVVTDYAFGSSRMLYSTASVLFAGKIDGRDVLYLYGSSTGEHEASIKFSGIPNKLTWSAASSFVTTQGRAGQTIVNFLSNIRGLVTVWDSDTQLVLFSDTDTAGTFWAPSTPSGQPSNFANFWQFGTNSSILVGGPYLVRDATITGRSLALRGDLKEDVRLTVIAPKTISYITWNGEDIGFLDSFYPTSSIRVANLAQNKATLTSIEIPKLTGWKYADSLPEIRPGYDDRTWVVANHSKTNNPNHMLYGDGRVLYGCDYGFCENTVLWRGHFEGTDQTKSLNLSINGGQAFAASVWLNDVFLGSSFGNSSNNHHIVEETDETFVFPDDTVKIGGDNVITVVQDNMGFDEGEEQESKNPRGIRGFSLNAGAFSEWKVQGKVGGYTNYPDKARGIFNEGGLFGERQGWHLPGYNISTVDWVLRDLSEGLPSGTAGIGFFVTTFDLAIARGLDVALSFTFEDRNKEQPYRALLFVNGWMMGKRIANLGPQYKFPVQEGILNHHGANTVAVALWAMTDEVVSPKLQLTLDGIVDGGVGNVEIHNPLWSDAGRKHV